MTDYFFLFVFGQDLVAGVFIGSVLALGCVSSQLWSRRKDQETM